MLSKPEKLFGRGSEEWDRVAPVLEAKGRLDDASRTALEAYCRAVYVWDYYATLGEDATDPVKRRDCLKIADAYAARMHAWAKDFGLTPRAERLLGGKADEDDGLNEFL